MLNFCFILLATLGNISAENTPERLWRSEWHPYEGKAVEISFEKKTKTYSSENKLKIKVTSSWSVFQNKSLFLQKVTEELQSKAEQVFVEYTQKYEQEEKEESDLDEEAISMDFDKRHISYSLTPTYASSSLVSVFGELHWYTGMPHGCCRYSSYNYWFDGKEMQEISLGSLFLSDKNFADFLTHFCLTTLKNERVGYCSLDPEDQIPIEITLEDVQVFTLSKSGLTITFRPYHVGGWADGPYSLTIPFEILTPFINPQGPLREFL